VPEQRKPASTWKQVLLVFGRRKTNSGEQEPLLKEPNNPKKQQKKLSFALFLSTVLTISKKKCTRRDFNEMP
jgi:hypothetical protein